MLGVAALGLTSCSANKSSMSYFDDIRNVADGYVGDTNYEVRIVPDDQLQIHVSSVDPTATVIYNMTTSQAPSVNPTTGVTTYVNSGMPANYLVSAQGDITFPVLGKIHVAGLTTAEVAQLLYDKISKEVDDPIVTVNLMNFRVNVLGEVNRPGMVTGNGGERFSIIDAIARAGDLSPYAVRDNVLLIRENNGRKEYHHLNLMDSKIMESPYFYLQQNDLVIVEPNDVRRANANYNTNNAYKIQVTSAVISACSVIASLVIALAVK